MPSVGRVGPRPANWPPIRGFVDVVAQMLEQRMSPEQIGGRLPLLFPDDPSMRVSHEVIYRALYVQGRGALKRELTACLRTGRVIRRPKRRVDARRSRQRITDMVMISERPPEVTDRAVPGHWEGDLIIGANGKSAIGTLVERTTRFTMLLHLPHGHSAHQLSHAITTTIGTLPTQLRRSLTWDQGIEMAHHATISIAADLDIYFCDPHSPWQRGTNENTNGLLRQYFPRTSTDFRTISQAELDTVARQLNNRPRQTLNWHNPAQTLNRFLVATAA
jgi:IS30 family transposase